MQEFFRKTINNKYVAIIIDSILFIVIIILLICVIIKLHNKNNKVEENLVVEKEEVEETKTLSKIKVNIKGEIANAGVYELDEGSTINDLINSSGGLTDKANIKNISLSTLLTDEMLVVIPSVNSTKKTSNEVTKVESKEPTTNNQDTSKEVEKGKVTITSKYEESIPSKTENTENNTPIVSESQTDNEINDDTVKENEVVIVNINTATITELTKLNGIGESKAQAIIDYRNANGPFKTIEDILNVKGIGEKIYDKIKEFITV